MTNNNNGDDAPTRRLVGVIEFEFTEDTEGFWHSEVIPRFETNDIREIYKLGLIVAVLQDTCSKKLGYIDSLIKIKEEVLKVHNELVAEKTLSDVDRLQKKLPFEEEI